MTRGSASTRSKAGRNRVLALAALALPLLLGAAVQADHAVRPETFFLVLIAILAAGKLGGELAERIGQPAVLGELVGGAIIGSSVLGLLPASGPIADIVGLLAEVGVALLLFEIGLETDLNEMFRVGAAASIVALVGVTAPFVLGFVYWMAFVPDIGAAAPGVTDSLVAVFVGATLTATSVGITARVLTDIGRIHTPEARIVIGAAVIDDVIGLVILAIVSGLAAGAALSVFGIAMKFAVAAGFLVAAVIIGNVLAPRIFSVIERMRVRGVLLVSAFAFALLFAALAGLANSAMIIGSFAAGIVLSSTNQFDLISDKIKPVSDVFTPIFFVSVGAAVDLRLFMPWSGMFDWNVLAVGGALFGIAIVGKVVSGFAVGWRETRLSHLAIGIGMVPRGEVGLICAHLGLAQGILSSELFSAVLIMVMATTFIAPPLLKPVFRRSGEPATAPLATPPGGGIEGVTIR